MRAYSIFNLYAITSVQCLQHGDNNLDIIPHFLSISQVQHKAVLPGFIGLYEALD